MAELMKPDISQRPNLERCEAFAVELGKLTAQQRQLEVLTVEGGCISPKRTASA